MPPLPETLTPERLRELADALEAREREVQGDGDGALLPDMTEGEYDAYVHENEKGWKGFMDKVRNLGSD